MRAAYFPTLSLTSVATRYSSASGTSSGETFTSNNYNVGLSTRYYLFQGFKTVAATDAALFNYNASTYQHESNRQDVILKIAQAYYKLVQAERLIRVADKSVERTRLHLDVANARVKAGVASRSDVLKAEVELSNAGLTLIRAKNGFSLGDNRVMGKRSFLSVTGGISKGRLKEEPMTRTIRLLVLGLSLAAMPLMAQGPHHGRGPGMDPGFGHPFACLELTEAQKSALKGVDDQHKASMEAKHAVVHEARKALHEAMRNPDVKEAELKALHEKASHAHFAVMLEHRSIMLESEALLTPEQKVQMEKMHKEHKGKGFGPGMKRGSGMEHRKGPGCPPLPPGGPDKLD